MYRAIQWLIELKDKVVLAQIWTSEYWLWVAIALFLLIITYSRPFA